MLHPRTGWQDAVHISLTTRSGLSQNHKKILRDILENPLEARVTLRIHRGHVVNLLAQISAHVKCRWQMCRWQLLHSLYSPGHFCNPCVASTNTKEIKSSAPQTIYAAPEAHFEGNRSLRVTYNLTTSE